MVESVVERFTQYSLSVVKSTSVRGVTRCVTTTARLECLTTVE